MNYKVQVQPSGREFTVDAGESILDAALRHGLAFPYGCRNGACGACKGKLLAGEVSYGDKSPRALSDADRADGTVVLCQAMPTGDITIRVKEVGPPRRSRCESCRPGSSS